MTGTKGRAPPSNRSIALTLQRGTVTAESTASWTGFSRDLKAGGLGDVYLVTSDAHLGIQAAVSDVLPNASWRCRTHFAKNLSSMVPKTQWPTSRRALTAPTPPIR